MTDANDPDPIDQWTDDLLSFFQGLAEFVDDLDEPDLLAELPKSDLINALGDAKDGVKAIAALVKHIEEAACDDQAHGSKLETDEYRVEFKNQVYRSKWKKDDLAKALRPQILWDPETGAERSGEMVFQLLAEVGILGAGPSIKALSKYGIDASDYCAELGIEYDNIRATVKPR